MKDMNCKCQYAKDHAEESDCAVTIECADHGKITFDFRDVRMDNSLPARHIGQSKRPEVNLKSLPQLYHRKGAIPRSSMNITMG